MELGTIIEHDFRVKVSDMTDIELHLEIAGQWDASRDFDEDQMNIMIQELVRRAKAQEALDRMVAENQRLGLYDDNPEVRGEAERCPHGVDDGACKECYSEKEEPPCKTHPDAPHGFDRNASHSADRYVCECEGWEPAVDNSAHEAENVYRNVDNVNMSEKHVHKSDKSIHEWVGLTHWEMQELMSIRFIDDAVLATEAKLKEKNT